MSSRTKKSGVSAETRRIQVKAQQLLENNIDAIGLGLVQKASEGNYNAAQLLLRLSGLDTDGGQSDLVEADEDPETARMFFLELVEQVLGNSPTHGHSVTKGREIRGRING